MPNHVLFPSLSEGPPGACFHRVPREPGYAQYSQIDLGGIWKRYTNAINKLGEDSEARKVLDTIKERGDRKLLTQFQQKWTDDPTWEWVAMFKRDTMQKKEEDRVLYISGRRAMDTIARSLSILRKSKPSLEKKQNLAGVFLIGKNSKSFAPCDFVFFLA